jgi:hypothetical protein
LWLPQGIALWVSCVVERSQAEKRVDRESGSPTDGTAPGANWAHIGYAALDADHFADLYRAVWKRLEQRSEIKSGLSGDDFLEQVQHKADYPASLEEHLDWLLEAGLCATCLHLHLNCALIAAVKKDEPVLTSLTKSRKESVPGGGRR